MFAIISWRKRALVEFLLLCGCPYFVSLTHGTVIVTFPRHAHLFLIFSKDTEKSTQKLILRLHNYIRVQIIKYSKILLMKYNVRYQNASLPQLTEGGVHSKVVLLFLRCWHC